MRKHGGQQSQGWHFDLRFLHYKSGSLARYSDFALDVRRIVKAQRIPGYRLSLARSAAGSEVLRFAALVTPSVREALRLAMRCAQAGDKR